MIAVQTLTVNITPANQMWRNQIVPIAIVELDIEEINVKLICAMS